MTGHALMKNQKFLDLLKIFNASPQGPILRLEGFPLSQLRPQMKSSRIRSEVLTKDCFERFFKSPSCF
jgi:hypothetical protein